MNGSADIFCEIKKLRKCPPILASSMDGVKEDIPGHFKSIYSDLYNSVDDKADLEEFAKAIENEVNVTHLDDVNRVTPDVVKELSSETFKG